MTHAGGSANINGILYQLLGTLDRACTAHLKAPHVKDEEIVSLLLTIEPAGGGGDIVLSADGDRRVEQWKAKARGGAWSLAKLVDEILPDLYQGLPEDLEGDKSRYCFVSEGRIGACQPACELFHNMATWPPSEGLIGRFDQSNKRHKLGKTKLSDRELFDRIVDRIAKRGGAKQLSDVTLRTRVRHLLARFQFTSPLSYDRLVARINTILRQHVNLIEDDDAKRRELCGVLLELAAEGDFTISAEQLLKRAGIPLHTFRDLDRLRLRLRGRLGEHLGAIRYDAALDVRSHLVGNSSVTALSGEGGQGKTWQLARFACEAAEQQSLVVWVPSARNNKDAVELAAREIWSFGLERDATLDLARIAERKSLANPDSTRPWAIVCVDDVNTREEAEYLSRLEWRTWGIRIVFTTNVEVGQFIEKRLLAEHIPIADFSTSELHRYLSLRGKEWQRISRDVERLIRRPILASIYASIVTTVFWRPESEYEVVEAFWDSISDPIDVAALRTLAGILKDDDAQYPWLAELTLQNNITRESIQRLIDAGWLKDLGQGSLGIWHQRLLGWAFAEALLSQLQSGIVSLDDVGNVAAACSDNTLPIAARGVTLGYTPMDLLWLAFNPASNTAHSLELWRLIAAMEGAAIHSHHARSLYEDSLGTLGPRAVSHVVRRVEHSAEAEDNFVPRYAARALKRIGTLHRQPVVEAARESVRSDNAALLELGLRLTAAFPEGADIERLWQVHRARLASEKPFHIRHVERQLSGAAFRTAVAHELSWLESALQKHEHDELEVTALVYSLVNIPGPLPKAIWQRQKERLLRVVPHEHRRCLVGCIVRFRDASELERLDNWVSEENLGATALRALAVFDHAQASRSLGRLPLREVAFNIDALGTSLFAGDPTIACDTVSAQVSDPESEPWPLIAVAAGHGDRLDPTLIDRIIDWLDIALVRLERSGAERSEHPLWRPLEIVEGLLGRRALEALRNRRGSDFEHRLADFACSRADNSSGWVDREATHARLILKRIAGAGHTRLTNALLIATAHTSRAKGCEEAVVNPDGLTFELLHSAALSDELWGEGPSGFPFVQQRAIDALATLARNRDLIDAILKWGAKISPYVSELRLGQPPMIDEDFRSALELLDRPAHPQYPNAILALGQTGRTELAERIQELLTTSSTDSDIAFAAVLALEDLVDDFTTVLDRLAIQYKSGHHKFPVLKAILKAPERIPDEFFLSLFSDDGTYDEIDSRLLSYLSGRDGTRQTAEEKIRRYVLENGGLSFHTFLDPAAHLDPTRPLEHELLWEQSRSPRGGESAILRLAQTEKDAAYEIALEALSRTDKDRNGMPDLLLRLDHRRATEDVCRVVISCRDPSLCREAGIALRRHAGEAAAKVELVAALQAGDWRNRRSAAMISSYLDPCCLSNELSQILVIDSSWEVCIEIQRALRRLQREAEAAAIVHTLQNLLGAEIWGALDNILQLADPDIATLTSDPLGLIAFLETASFALRRYVSHQLKKQHEAIAKEFKSIHGRWDDDE